MNRDFKGIWIPKEIWLNENLTPTEKFAWAEVHSLYDKDKGGCWASNEYLAEFLCITSDHAGRVIAKLKKLGLMEQVSFDGRTRVLKSRLLAKSLNIVETSTQVRPGIEAGAESASMPPYSSSYPKKKVDDEYTKKEPPCVGFSVLTKTESKLFGKSVQLTIEAHEELEAKYGKDLVAEVIEQINDYLAATGKKPYKDYAAAIRNWIKRMKTKPSENPNRKNAEEVYALMQEAGQAHKLQLAFEGIRVLPSKELILYSLSKERFDQEVYKHFNIKDE